jgi:hypothetical protein
MEFKVHFHFQKGQQPARVLRYTNSEIHQIKILIKYIELNKIIITGFFYYTHIATINASISKVTPT